MTQHTEQMFDRYYDSFLRNAFLRTERWSISLGNGREFVATPWASSIVSLSNPTFMVRETGGKVYALPFKDLEAAERIEQ